MPGSLSNGCERTDQKKPRGAVAGEEKHQKPDPPPAQAKRGRKASEGRAVTVCHRRSWRWEPQARAARRSPEKNIISAQLGNSSSFCRCPSPVPSPPSPALLVSGCSVDFPLLICELLEYQNYPGRQSPVELQRNFAFHQSSCLEG